jgi:DNA-binding protein H-NS
MNNPYLLCIQLSLYIYDLLKAKEGGFLMAEGPKTICEWLDIDLGRLTGEDKINLISEVCDTLSVPELMAIRNIISEKRQEKLEDAKTALIAEMSAKIEALGLTYEDVMGANKIRTRSKLPPRYISPEGKTWSGRGYRPKWIRDLEEAGHKREDYRIQEEGVS